MLSPATPSTSSTRPATLLATWKGLTWSSGDAAGAVVDVEVDGHRVWSAALDPAIRGGRRRLPWPPVLSPHVAGSGEILIRDQSTGRPIAAGSYRFPGSTGRRPVAELARAGLVVDKWGKLVAGPTAALHRALMAGLDRVLADLADEGFSASITGGTLLGAIRDGLILERDDDIDLLVYLGERHPADVSLESYRIERALAARGHRVVRHSDAHLQVMVGETGAETAHVDVFIGFQHGGRYNQPIAVRGEFPEHRILPFGAATLDGRPYPAVADPEGWLELCYGPNWRIPDPVFRFRTPEATRRRFENWFGIYDLNRHAWERSARRSNQTAWAEDADLLSALAPEGGRVIDLGCGRGELAARLADAGHDVLAVDYALSAVDAAERAAEGRFAVGRLNLSDRRDVLELAADEASRGGRVDVLLSDVLAYLNRDTRRNVFRLLRALLEDGVAVASFPVNPSIRYDHHRPDTWHLPVAWILREARPLGLAVEFRGFRYRRTTAGRRLIATALIRRRPEPDPNRIRRAPTP